MTRKRAKVGDVVSFGTSKGVAYLHWVSTDPEYGALVRVLPGVFAEEPSHPLSLAEGPHRFFTFFPVGAAVTEGLCTVIGAQKLPRGLDVPPRMRRAGARLRDGRVLTWLVDEPGGRERLTEQLTDDEALLSIRSIWNAEMLEQRILSDWKPEDER